jgi:hypothetical protein
MILFRPVGPKELELIASSGYTAFPPRLPEQPIFYPFSILNMPNKLLGIGMPLPALPLVM